MNNLDRPKHLQPNFVILNFEEEMEKFYSSIYGLNDLNFNVEEILKYAFEFSLINNLDYFDQKIKLTVENITKGTCEKDLEVLIKIFKELITMLKKKLEFFKLEDMDGKLNYSVKSFKDFLNNPNRVLLVSNFLVKN